MCRFLAIKSTSSQNHQSLLHQFSLACKKSKTIEGDDQGDGWGMAWLDQNQSWQSYHSLAPIWQETAQFSQVKTSQQILVHARSASFNDFRQDVTVNQPYIKNNYIFVFNGVIYGVKSPFKLTGKIGAQKIFNLLLINLKKYSPNLALAKTYQLIKNNSGQIKGFNCLLADQQKFYFLSDYDANLKNDYFELNFFQNQNIKIVCSEKIADFPWKVLSKSQVISL